MADSWQTKAEIIAISMAYVTGRGIARRANMFLQQGFLLIIMAWQLRALLLPEIVIIMNIFCKMIAIAMNLTRAGSLL
jgi:hypothetical protein